MRIIQSGQLYPYYSFVKLPAHRAGLAEHLPVKKRLDPLGLLGLLLFPLLVVTIYAKKILSRRGQNLYHNLFSTTSADDFIGFLEHPLFVTLPGKVSPSSSHLYPFVRIVIYRVTPAGAQAEAPEFLYPSGA